MGTTETLAAARRLGLTKNLPPMVVQVKAVNPDTPFDATRPMSATVDWVVHPVIAASLEAAGARRRGKATFAIPLGEADPAPEALRALLDTVARGTLHPEEYAGTKKAAYNLWERHRGQSHYQRARRLISMFSGTDGWRIMSRREGQLAATHPDAGTAAAWSGAVLTCSRSTGWVKFFTHLPVDCVPEHIRALLDLRPARQYVRQPRPRRPIDLHPTLEWVTSQGVPVLDPDGVWAATRAVAAGGVVAWPQPGAPAKVSLTVPQRMRPAANGIPLGLAQADGSTLYHGAGTVTDLANLLAVLPDAEHAVSAGVADVLDMAAADVHVTDAPLYDYQCEVVGRHLATAFGQVVALSPGMGKTVTTLEAWRVKAETNRRFRGLVITEAALRSQWAAEVGVWFPAARVVVATRADDAEQVTEALAHDGPVVIIVAYSAMRYVADTTARRDWNRKFPHLAAALETPGDGDAVPDAPGMPALGPGEQATLFNVVDEADAAPVPDYEADAEPVAPAGADDVVEAPDGFDLDLPFEQDEEAVAEPPADLHPLGEVLLDAWFHDLAVDEAEPLRGTGSKAAKGAWALRSRAQVATVLTGTPINRSVDDLGRLVAYARGEADLFDGVRLSNRFDLARDADLLALNDALGPTVYRRATSEATGRMPRVVPQVVMLTPSAAEIALNEAALGELKRVYDELVALMETAEGLHPDSPEYAEAAAALRQARGAWLGGTTLARQAASDPAALLGAHSAAAELLAAQGVIAAATERPGTKRTAAIADITERVMNGERVLVFTEFATVARGLISDLDEAGVRVGQVLGGGGKRRDHDVAEFQAGRLDALVLTSSGEKGLNLQAATTLIHYDLPWTPKGVLQRTGRARRLASDHEAINVVFYVLAHTIEERVAALVVSRAVEAMRVLDVSRGLAVAQTDLGSAFAGLTQAAADTREGRQHSVLMEVTKALVADAN